MDNCILLKCYGTHAIVYNQEGKEITRREGFNDPKTFLVKFPCTIDFFKCKVEGAEVLSKQVIPLQYPIIELPSWEKTPSHTIIKKKTYIPNWHSPASINVKSGEMLYNQRFLTFSIAKQIFIENHERGHFYYNTEKYCDLYAAVQIMKKGFGISQCLEVLRNTLHDSPEKDERYNYVNSMIKKSL